MKLLLSQTLSPMARQFFFLVASALVDSIFTARSYSLFQVCLRAFTSIYGISEKRLRTIQAKPQDPRDKRGTHSTRPNKIPEELKQKVKRLFSYDGV